MAAAPNEFVAHCKELLASTGSVRTRRMFGGHGFYVDELFVALTFAQRLYLKVDAQTRASFEAEGCVPFVYDSAGEAVSLGYFSAPEEAMESPPLMAPWARLAFSAALRARVAKPIRSKAAKASRATPQVAGRSRGSSSK